MTEDKETHWQDAFPGVPESRLTAEQVDQARAQAKIPSQQWKTMVQDASDRHQRKAQKVKRTKLLGANGNSAVTAANPKTDTSVQYGFGRPSKDVTYHTGRLGGPPGVLAHDPFDEKSEKVTSSVVVVVANYSDQGELTSVAPLVHYVARERQDMDGRPEKFWDPENVSLPTELLNPDAILEVRNRGGFLDYYQLLELKTDGLPDAVIQANPDVKFLNAQGRSMRPVRLLANEEFANLSHQMKAQVVPVSQYIK